MYTLFETIDQCEVPVIACVQKYVLGGGIGLISVCDYVVANANTQFSFSETKMGLIPACIGPFVLKKLGQSWTRAMFLSAQRFKVGQALQMGLIHEIATDVEDELMRGKAIAKKICESSSMAVTSTKGFLSQMHGQSQDFQKDLAIKTLAGVRVTPDAQEGIQAFFEKRKPIWGMDE